MQASNSGSGSGAGCDSEFHFKAIGFVRTPFKDKFGVPRQPGLASSARGVIKILPMPDLKTALRSLDEFSHLWIVFVFHEHGGRNWKPSIRPPRLGGAKKVGVLSSRSPHRPNPIGMSAVAIDRIDFDAEGGPEIHVLGVDLIDGTPVLDLKPYIPYADAIPNANAGWAADPITRYEVVFSEPAEKRLSELSAAGSDTDAGSNLRSMIVDLIGLDPRPAYQKRQIPISPTNAGTKFGIEIANYEIKYELTASGFRVTSIG